MEKQVDKDHYSFSYYITKKRWASFWHQLNEVIELSPKSVLEVGPGPGLFKGMARLFNIDVKTLDIAEDLNPDYLCSAADMSLNDSEFDLICCFQMLEHLPYELALKAFSEMVRVSSKHIIISLPDAKKVWPYSFHIPKKGTKTIHITRPFCPLEKHEFNGQHYWEVNKIGYEVDKVIRDLIEAGKNVELVKTYLVPENTYHRFFIFKVK